MLDQAREKRQRQLKDHAEEQRRSLAIVREWERELASFDREESLARGRRITWDMFVAASSASKRCWKELSATEPGYTSLVCDHFVLDADACPCEGIHWDHMYRLTTLQEDSPVWHLCGLCVREKHKEDILYAAVTEEMLADGVLIDPVCYEPELLVTDELNK